MNEPASVALALVFGTLIGLSLGSLGAGGSILTVPILVVRTVTELFNWPAGSAFAILFFAITLAILWVYLRIMGWASRGVS